MRAMVGLNAIEMRDNVTEIRCTPRHVWVVRRMPTSLRDMHPSSGHTLAEVLRNLSAKLTQEASSIR